MHKNDYIFQKLEDPSRADEWMDLAVQAGIKDADLTRKNLMDYFANPERDVFTPYMIIRSDDNKIVGTLLLRHTEQDFRNAYSVCHVAITQDLRGTGLGSKFMYYIFDEIVRLGKEYVVLYTGQDTDYFYKSLGMVEYGRFPDILPGENGLRDRVYLYKDLRETS